jgi:phosphoglycerate dehydrogenase-like enzyme
MKKLAILDDYQNVALSMADWTVLAGSADVTVFDRHLGDLDAVVDALVPFDIVCAMRERTVFSRTLFERLPNLKLLVTTGMRNLSIDMAAAADHGVTVCGTAGSLDGTAELIWALIQGVVRNLPQEDRATREGRWQVGVGKTLAGRTLGLVGLGRLGGRTAEIARLFNMDILAWSQNLTDERAAECGARRVELDELMAASDIVSVHLVLSERSRGIIGAHELGLMKPGAYLVNTARGPIVDEAALIAALDSRTIAGAALDVFDVEPLPRDHPFLAMEHVLLSPHMAYVTRETYQVFYRETVEDVACWIKGEPVRVLSAT